MRQPYKKVTQSVAEPAAVRQPAEMGGSGWWPWMIEAKLEAAK